MMFSTYSNNEREVYEILSKILGVKFKSQIKDSGIVFSEIHELKNLQNGNIEYLLVVDTLFLRFKNTEQFLLTFITYLQKNLKEINSDYKQLQDHRYNDLVVDEVAIYHREEELSHKSGKQLALLKRMRELYDKIQERSKKG